MEEKFVKEREKFVTGHNGGSMFEIVLIVLVQALSILLNQLALPWIFNHNTDYYDKFGFFNRLFYFLIDFGTLFAPTVFVLTLLAEDIYCVIFTLISASSIIVLFSIIERCQACQPGLGPLTKIRNLVQNSLEVAERRQNPEKSVAVSYSRACLHVMTALCILAVDFPVFPRRFAKTETFGISLMDTGVGLFTFLVGLCWTRAPLFPSKISQKSSFNGIWWLFMIGSVRLLVLKLLNYQVHTSEYGVHWNFFFTLASVKLFFALLPRQFDIYRYGGFCSLMISIVYEFLCLHYAKLDVWILSNERNVENFWDANREGVFSLFGFVPILMAGCQTSVVFKERKSFCSRLESIIRLTSHALLAYAALTLLSWYGFMPSRRLANLSYFLWIIVISLTSLAVFIAIELIVNLFYCCKPDWDYDNKNYISRMNLLNIISRNGLLFFLVANLFTGLTNIFFEPINMTNGLVCVIYLLAYCLFICMVVCLSVWFIKRK